MADLNPSARQVLLDLADRCEKERPSRELDAALAKSAGVDSRSRRTSRGVNKGREWRVDSHGGVETWERRPPAYTSSLDAAVTLVPEGWHQIIGQNCRIGAWSCELRLPIKSDPYGTKEACGTARTEVMARVAAALRARAEAL